MEIPVVYRDHNLAIIRCEDLFYPDYKGEYFVIEKTDGYGYFYNITRTFTRGAILDKYNIILPEKAQPETPPEPQQ